MREKQSESVARDKHLARAVAAEGCARAKSGFGLVWEAKGGISFSCTLVCFSADTSSILQSSHEPLLYRRGTKKTLVCVGLRAQCAILPRRPAPAHTGSQPPKTHPQTQQTKIAKPRPLPYSIPPPSSPHKLKHILALPPDPIRTSLNTAWPVERRCFGLRTSD